MTTARCHAVAVTVLCVACQSPSSHGVPAILASASPPLASSSMSGAADAGPHFAAGDDGTRAATGTVSIVQSRTPSATANASASFFDTTYADPSQSDLCAHKTTSAPSCNVTVCPSPLPQGAGAHTTRPLAGTITGRVGAHEFRLRPVGGWYGSEQISFPALRGGETVRFEADGDPGGVPAFSGQVVAPVFVTLTTPRARGEPRLPAGAPFDVAWSPASPDGILRVELVAVRPTMQTHVVCEFEGRSGKGTVPADAIGQLSPGILVMSVDAVSTTMATAGPFAVKLEVSNSILSSTGKRGAK